MYLETTPYGWIEITPRKYNVFKHGLSDLMNYCEHTFQDNRWGFNSRGYFFFRNNTDALMFLIKWS
jgi:hypothetical protein